MNSVGELLAASPLPRLEARLLLMKAAGLSRTQVTAYPELEPAAGGISAFLELQARRLAGEPIAYLLGEREFYGRAFRVTPDVLIPRPETEHLIEWALRSLEGVAAPRILDLGTGSGIVAVTLALERPDAEVWAVDLSPAALAVARDNAAALGARVRFFESDWYAALPPAAFDLIASNPPYIEAGDAHLSQGDLRFEPPMALTDFADGYAALRVIFGQAPERLRPGGRVLAEHGWEQAPTCRALCRAAGLADVASERDLAGLERVTGARRA